LPDVNRLHLGDEQVVRVRTLLILRWLAILGQLAAILFVAMVLEFKMPIAACLGLVAVSAWSNVFLRLRFADDRRVPEDWTAWVMGFDIAQLALQMGLTGGLTNPFAILLIAPVMVSATTLSGSRTWTLGAFVLLCSSILAVFHLPLPWYDGERFAPPLLFVGGVWIALVGSLGFMATYAFRIAEERRQLAAALAATEIVLSREQNLHALDGLAAAAAHELGTPLATMTVIIRELERDLDPASPHVDDVALLKSQAQRCRDILAKLATLGQDSESPLQRLAVRTLIEEVVMPHRGTGVEIVIATDGPADDPPVIARNPAMHYGLGNLVENAVDFAETAVTVSALWTADRLTLTIADDGPGFSDDVMARLGEPFVSRRAGHEHGGGLGLGFFIAKTLLERTGAAVTFRRENGATVEVSWRREAIAPHHD
jgi:two-component system, sensor histidine kinase RegB